MSVLTDADLYLRGAETLLASWQEYAREATGAAEQRSSGVATAGASTCTTASSWFNIAVAASTSARAPS